MSAQGHDEEGKSLNMYYPKKKNQPTQKKVVIGVYAVLISMIVYQGLTSFCGAGFYDGLTALMVNLLFLLLFLIFLWLSIPLHVVAHELGHAFAGMSRGMKVILLSFGRWRYERVVKGFQWRKSEPIPGIAGVAALIIDTTVQRPYSRFDYVIFLLGGVTVNLFLGGAAFTAGGYIESHNVFLGLLKQMLDAFGFVGLFLGVFNLLPIKVKGWCTDGLLIWKTLHGDGWSLNKRSIYLGSLTLNGLSPRLWPESDLPTWEELQRQNVPLPFQMGGHHLRLLYALDTDNQEMAEKSAVWVAEHFNLLPDGTRQGMALLMAFFAVRFLKSEAVYRVWRPLCEGGLFNLFASRHLLDAEYACLRQNISGAKDAIQKTRNVLLQLPTQQHISEMQERLSSLEERLENRGKQE